MMRFSKQGVLLADVPPAGVSRVDPDAASGNPRHDVRSGKFAPGGPGRKPNVPTPANADPYAFARMLDAARDAAREYDNPQVEELREFLAGRAANPEAVDLDAFLSLVIEWKKNDLVDLLDNQLGSAGKKVKMSASRGFIRASLGGLDANAQAEVLNRLEARGHDRKAIDKIFGKKAADPEKATKKRDQVAASLDFSADMVALLDMDQKGAIDAIELTGKIAKVITSELPQPIVNVTPEIRVEVPPPPEPLKLSGRKIVKRDDRGFITEVIDAED